MLVFAVLLQAVPLKPEDAPALPRLTDPAGARADLRDRRFRLDVERAPIEDAKRAALRGVWLPCETTGAPVCPGKGRLVLRAEIEPRR